MNYLIRLLACGAAIYFLPKVLPSVYVDSFTTAVIVAFVMSVLNNFVKPVLAILSFPITIVTLGLFYFVITYAIVSLCDYLIDGFAIDGFWTSLLFSFILSIVNSIVGSYQKAVRA